MLPEFRLSEKYQVTYPGHHQQKVHDQNHHLKGSDHMKNKVAYCITWV